MRVCHESAAETDDGVVRPWDKPPPPAMHRHRFAAVRRLSGGQSGRGDRLQGGNASCACLVVGQVALPHGHPRPAGANVPCHHVPSAVSCPAVRRPVADREVRLLARLQSTRSPLVYCAPRLPPTLGCTHATIARLHRELITTKPGLLRPPVAVMLRVLPGPAVDCLVLAGPGLIPFVAGCSGGRRGRRRGRHAGLCPRFFCLPGRWRRRFYHEASPRRAASFHACLLLLLLLGLAGPLPRSFALALRVAWQDNA